MSSVLSIGKRWPKGPKGDYKAECAYCGQRFRRSVLRKDGAGRLACPDDFGPDEVSLTKANAALGAKANKRIIGKARDGAYHPSGPYAPTTSPTGGLDAQGRPVSPP